MRSENSIEVRKLTKKFKVYLDKGQTLKEKTLFRKRRVFVERSVLNGISFEVKTGEAIGLIGHNGCGKSTTLKLLTRIMYPDSGTIEMRGRVSSLIELGTGFHPDMSGRENIYINASIFGLNKKEIDERITDIIGFSELEEFIDNPVRTYSSGMYMRLAFSVAINVKADILLIDEILAVGDANFQVKCFEKLRELKKKGITIVIVSHSLNQIEQICDKSYWIDQGKIKKSGTPREVHPVYMDYMGKKRKGSCENKVQEIEKDNNDNIVKEVGSLDVKMTGVELFDHEGHKKNIFQVSSKIILKVQYEQINTDIKESLIGFHIFRSDGVDCYGSNTGIDNVEKIRLKKHGEINIEFTSVSLLQGNYKIDLAFHDENGFMYHYIYDAANFEILNEKGEIGVSRMDHKWFFDDYEPEKISEL